MSKYKLFFVFVSILVFSTASFAAVLLDRVVAVVNKEVITWSELYMTMEIDAAPGVKQLNEDERGKIFREKEAEFLENLIDVKLILQEAAKAGIGVTEKELDEAIENIKTKYSMSETEFRDSLKKEGYTLEAYRKRLKEQIIAGKVVNQRIRSKIMVPEEDITRYIKENSGSADMADSYRIGQILIKIPDKDEDKALAEEKATVILNELDAGESFSQLAKKYSEDASADTGGDLGVIRKSDLDGEFRDVLSELKPGEVSRPFWTRRGLHIIKLYEKIGSEDHARIRAEAKKILSEKIFIEKYNAWIKGLREKAYIEVRL